MALGSSRWTAPRWSLPRWHAATRFLQAIGFLATAVLNGFLIAYLHANKADGANRLLVLEAMAIAALIYSGLVLLIQHTGRRRQNPSAWMLTTFVVGDVLLNGLTIGIVTILAQSGVPSDCHGFETTEQAPHSGEVNYIQDTERSRYSEVQVLQRGFDNTEYLDRYCSLEKGFYFIAVGLIFTCMITVTLGVLRIFERYHMTSPPADQLLTGDYGHQLDPMQPKLVGQNESVVDLEHRRTPATPEITVASSSQNLPVHPPVHAQGPVSPTSLYPSSFLGRSPTVLLPGSPISPISPVSPASPSFSPDHRMYDETTHGLMIGQAPDPGAEATVTDGYRHQTQTGGMHSSLPPYSPGNMMMQGHAYESNETRLTDYVKGQTRAQDMKDSGGGF